MASRLLELGWRNAPPKTADVVIVSTCGFIGQAVEESLLSLRNYGRQKGKGQMLIAAGCLAERWSGRLLAEVEALDGLVGTRRWAEIGEAIARARQGERPVLTGGELSDPPRRRLASGASAYLKIADGCDCRCTFCTIPAIKGAYHSRPINDLVAEASQLEGLGVKELILIAQDSTAWGRDLTPASSVTRLMERLLAETTIPWLRVMYAYPTGLMAGEPRLLSYIDLPLQHAHPAVLRRMGRPTKSPLALVERVRELVPDVCLRSTFIAGFPEEDEEEFQVLLDFLQAARLDRVGVFAYSAEEGTPAALLTQVRESVKQRRVRDAMLLQQEISRQGNQALVGSELLVLCEGRIVSPGIRVGKRSLRYVHQATRSYREAPEIDGYVYVRGRLLPAGEFMRVRVTRADAYDLVAEALVEE